MVNKKRKRVEIAEIDKGDNKKEALAKQTTLILMIKGQEKVNEQEDDERKKNLEEFRLKIEFQIFINLFMFLGCFQDTRLLFE